MENGLFLIGFCPWLEEVFKYRNNLKGERAERQKGKAES